MWLPQLLVNVHCKLPQHIYLRCGHVHILTCYDWCKMNSDIEFVWRFYQESVTYGQCVQDLCRASPVGEICSSSQEVLLSLIPRSPLFFFCSGYVLYNTYKAESGEKCGRPEPTHHMNDVRWTWGEGPNRKNLSIANHVSRFFYVICSFRAFPHTIHSCSLLHPAT